MVYFSWQLKSSLEGSKQLFSFVLKAVSGMWIGERFTEPKYLFISSFLPAVEGKK